MFYVIWSGKKQITLFVISAIIITMVSMAINLWSRIFRYPCEATPPASHGGYFTQKRLSGAATI
jgi:hypothetical protein